MKTNEYQASNGTRFESKTECVNHESTQKTIEAARILIEHCESMERCAFCPFNNSGDRCLIGEPFLMDIDELYDVED